MEKKNFKFKNKRNYVHGTDIFNYLVNKKKYNLIDIKFKKPLKYKPIINKSAKNNSKNVSIECTLIEKKQIRKISIFNSKKKIKGKYFVKEDIPSNSVKFLKKGVKCDYITKKTPIEVLVTLTKMLHIKKISKKRKWLFTRIVLKNNFKYNLKKKFKIIIDQNYKNISTISKIYEYDKKIGLINFIGKY